ncbi:MAG TPA: tripartite tricarboxylate transporter substrate binding protein [Eoetvoesiella sp.]
MKLLGAISLTLGVLMSSVAWADNFPSRPITMIVPFPPGGATDIQIRKLSELASKHLGQPIVVTNKPGAGGTMGAVALANAQPDGYTLSQIPVGVFRQPHITKTAFDPKELSYIIGVSGYLFGAAVRADAPWKTFNELVSYAKANPGKLRFGSIGVGSVQHTTMEAVAEAKGLDWLHVPYKGNSEVNLALLSGQIDFSSDGSGWASLVDAGKVRLLAVYGQSRPKNWPDVPTLKELGFDITESSPYGIGAPAGLPPEVRTILHDAFQKALNDPEHLRTLETLNQEVIYMTGEQFTEHAAKQTEIQQAIVERFGLSTQKKG